MRALKSRGLVPLYLLFGRVLSVFLAPILVASVACAVVRIGSWVQPAVELT